MLAEEIGTDCCTVIGQDGYFSDCSEFLEAEREAARSHNHPPSVRWEYLRADLASLRDGRRVEGAPPATVLARGSADPHERVLRRIERTMAREGAELDAAIPWYRRDVIPNYPHYTKTTRVRGSRRALRPAKQDRGTVDRGGARGFARTRLTSGDDREMIPPWRSHEQMPRNVS